MPTTASVSCACCRLQALRNTGVYWGLGQSCFLHVKVAYGVAPLDFALGGASTSSYNSNSTPMHRQGNEQLGMPLSAPILSLNPSETSDLRDDIFDGQLVGCGPPPSPVTVLGLMGGHC